jgi:GntR family transcriptional regulator, transcriptional repressor for pyruvate dehydrogenase complex
VQAIRDEELPRGSQLPGEHELAEGLAVGRSTIREALRSMERESLVETTSPESIRSVGERLESQR